jgi:hypothetical protein
MTSHSLVPMSARAAGISYEALCVQLLSMAALDQPPAAPAGRGRAMSEAIATPFDVRLMNITASVLFLVFGVLALGALAGWVGNHALFAIRAITVLGDVSHNNAVTLRANVLPRLGGSFFTLDLAQARESFEAVPWVRRRGAARVSEPAQGDPAGAPGRGLLGCRGRLAAAELLWRGVRGQHRRGRA